MARGGVTATVGIVGAGQLARMAHQAAITLDIEVVVLADTPTDPAVRAGARHLIGRPDRIEDLVALAEQVDVVTVEHERTPAALLAQLEARGHRVAPSAAVAALGQDKVATRLELGRSGVPLAPWAVARDVEEVRRFAAEHGWPLVAKAPTGGYDGRGVWVLADDRSAGAVLEEVGGPLLLEPQLRFSHELSVLVVRGRDGDVAAYPAVETVQVDGQCHEVFAPATVTPALDRSARQLAVRVAGAIDLHGLLAVELFVVDGELVLNELAARPHNSGHLTIEACATSQFENHLRAVAGLPLGATDLIVPAAAMANVLGAADGSDPFAAIAAGLAVPGVAIHRYGKTARPHRKIGHLTATGADLDAARATAARARHALTAGRAA